MPTPDLVAEICVGMGTMKRFTLFLFSLILSVVFSTSALAYDVKIDGICYNLISEGKTAEVTSGEEKYSGEVVIPSSITSEGKKYTVTSIGKQAFLSCKGLTSVTIGNSVTSIGNGAFAYCSGLTSVTIPNSVTSIGKTAFESCSGLTSVTIGNSVTSIGNYAFQDCSGLTSITIPNSVTSIGNYAFQDCSGLTSVTIPNSVTSIGSYAFYGCSRLEDIIIVNDMFVHLPETYSGPYSIPENISQIIGGAFRDCSGLTSITIPNSVTSIGDGAFRNCSGLTSITIPNSVTSIGESAFNGCSKLTSVTIPNSVTSIGWGAFGSCTQLENVYCYAEEIPSTNATAFDHSSIESSTLYVPSSALSSYKTTAPWSGFGTIKALNDTPANINTAKTLGIVIQSAGGFITLSGLDTNERVDFFAIDGAALGSATATDGTATFSATSGTIVVAKIGKESVKIAVE